MAGRCRRQSDALRRRRARRHVARIAHRRHGQRHLRRRPTRREFREPESREHVLGQVLPPLCERRHGAAALSRFRAVVGRLLFDEPRRDRMDHSQSLRRQQALERRHKIAHRRGVRSARDQGADHPVRVDGRQHHAAAAGVQLGRRRLRVHRRDQVTRASDRRSDARERRAPRHLRIGQGREEGACANRLGVEVDRGAPAGFVRHADQGAEGRKRRDRV